MARWFKPKKKEEPSILIREIDFNREKLNAQIDNLRSKISAFKDETGFQIIEEVVRLAKNIQLLEVNRVRDERELYQHQGRLQAFTDLADYIERSKKPVKEREEGERKTPRDAVRTRRVDSQAGAAI